MKPSGRTSGIEKEPPFPEGDQQLKKSTPGQNGVMLVVSRKTAAPPHPVANVWCAHTVNDDAVIIEEGEHHAAVAEQWLSGEHEQVSPHDAPGPTRISM